MTERSQGRAAHLSWLWVLPLLLAAALAIPQLDRDAFHADESSSLIVAGALRPGPWSLAEVWSAVARRSPEQALGWPMLLSIWGRVAGWSEVAVRALTLFAGMLALAWVGRTGRDLFAPRAGLFATLLLATSAFFLLYLSYARAFSLVTCFGTMCLWHYWRVALQPRPPGRVARAGLLLAATGLLYMHYFGALLLPVLGLFHLLFVPKNRRWWQAILLFGLATLAAALQAPIYLQGLAQAASDRNLQNRAMNAAELLGRFASFLTNGIVDLQIVPGAVPLVLLLLALIVAAGLRLRSDNRTTAGWFLVFVTGALLLLIVALNEVLRVIGTERLRYLIALWPLVALVAGAGLWQLAGKRRRLVTVLLALWLIFGAHTSMRPEFRYELDYLKRSDFHRVYRYMLEHIPASDFLILDHKARNLDSVLLHTRLLALPYGILYREAEDPLAEVAPAHAAHRHAWLLYRTLDREVVVAQVNSLGRIACERVLDAWGFTLERHALAEEGCLDSPLRLAFEEGIDLSGLEITRSGDLLRIEAVLRSANYQLPDRYSLAIHLIDARRDERVAQGDVGVGPGLFVPLHSEVDISALQPGDYEVHLALYDWRTGERMPARDLVTGVTDNIHVVHRFRID